MYIFLCMFFCVWWLYTPISVSIHQIRDDSLDRKETWCLTAKMRSTSVSLSPTRIPLGFSHLLCILRYVLQIIARGGLAVVTRHTCVTRHPIGPGGSATTVTAYGLPLITHSRIFLRIRKTFTTRSSTCGNSSGYAPSLNNHVKTFYFYLIFFCIFTNKRVIKVSIKVSKTKSTYIGIYILL